MDWSNDEGESNMYQKDPLDVLDDLDKDIFSKTRYPAKWSINLGINPAFTSGARLNTDQVLYELVYKILILESFKNFHS